MHLQPSSRCRDFAFATKANSSVNEKGKTEQNEKVIKKLRERVKAYAETELNKLKWKWGGCIFET